MSVSSKEKSGSQQELKAAPIGTSERSDNSKGDAENKKRRYVLPAGRCGLKYRAPESLTLSMAQQIAESIVGPVQWSGAEGLCRCPGEDLHTTATNSTDANVYCQPVAKGGAEVKPGVYCFHDSCRCEREEVSFRLRSALGKHSPAPRKFSPPPVAARKKEPEFSPAILAKSAAKLNGVNDAWLAARSPIRPDNRTPVSFLHALYRPDEKVVIFDEYESQGQHVWTANLPPFDGQELDSFRTGKRCGVWFLTNPVDGKYQKNDQGRTSRRSWQNITSWRYLVAESDKADPALWLAALARMPLRIAAIYRSGGKSIHALVRLDAASKAEWDTACAAMKPDLVTFGADHKALSAVRLSRLPCCERLGTVNNRGEYILFPKPQMQALLYLNPQPDRTPICELPVAPHQSTESRRILN